MDIQFIKLHSGGRDFILFDAIKTQPAEPIAWQSLSKAISDRHLGVGGFGFLVIERGKEAPVRVQVLESDGIESELGPDALLCCARYAYDAGLLGKENSQIESADKSFRVDMIDAKNITAELGPPYSWRDSRELKEESNLDLDETVTIRRKDCTITPLDFFGLHAVVFDTETPINLLRLGRHLSRLPLFTNSPTIELVRVYSREEIRVRIWNPTAKELYSSCAGDGAAVVASVVHGFTDREVLVHNRGGDIFVKWSETNNHLYVTTSVEYSFIGTFYWEGSFGRNL
jgi:diaminopimelate epimerase